MIVVDTSVVICWFVEQEQSRAARAFLESEPDLAAPDLLGLEVANGLFKYVHRGVMEESAWFDAVENELPNAVVVWSDVSALLPAAMRIAARHGGAIQDACFIALAQSLDLPLATADKQQAEAARKLNISVQFVA